MCVGREGERLLTYDDKDLGSSKPAVSFRFFNIALSERERIKDVMAGVRSKEMTEHVSCIVRLYKAFMMLPQG